MGVAVRTLREEEALRRSEEGKARRKRNTLKMPGKQQQQHQQEEQDLQQLKQLIPGLGGGANVSQVEVMKEAAKYIDQLQNSLICRIRTHDFPEKLKSSSTTSSSSDQDSESIKSA